MSREELLALVQRGPRPDPAVVAHVRHECLAEKAGAQYARWREASGNAEALGRLAAAIGRASGYHDVDYHAAFTQANQAHKWAADLWRIYARAKGEADRALRLANRVSKEYGRAM